MDERLQLRLQRQGWDRAATHYESSWQAPLDVARRVLLDRQPVRPGDRVLDVACGTGHFTHELARIAGLGGQVFGIDLSQAMVDAARRRQSPAGSASSHYMRMDAQSLQFPSASFDVVLCCFGLMYAPDPERALAEMRRVLRPSGRLCIAIWGKRARCAWAPVFSIVEAEVASDVCPLFFRLGDDGALAQARRATGLAVTWQTRIMSALSHRDADEACDAMFLAGPAALAWSRFGEQVRARVRRCYLESIEPWRTASAYALPAEFVCLQAHPS